MGLAMNPFGAKRHHVFEQEFYKQSLQEKVDILLPETIDQSVLELFHTHDYVEQVKQQSKQGTGYLDQGDTPAFIGMYEAASFVVGSVCDAVVMCQHFSGHKITLLFANFHNLRKTNIHFLNDGVDGISLHTSLK